jgi:hypothetical protein
MLVNLLNTEYIDNEVKKYLKDNLKIEVEHQAPHTFNNGYVKVGIYWDNELINEDIQKIYQSFF